MKKKIDYAVFKVPKFQGHFQHLTQMKTVLHNELPEQYTSVDNQVGHIQPGHGAKRRQLW